MKKNMRRVLAGLLAVTALCATTACGSKSSTPTLKKQRVRVVIGSKSTSGDTYMTADVATRYLSKALDFNGKVDSIGANNALEEIVTAKPDGSTIMMFHDMTWLGVSFGAYEDKYALENFVVGPRMAISQGPCFAVKKDAPYATMAEMADWLKANPGETVKLAVEAGGVSQLGFNSYYEWVKETYGDDVASRVKAFISGDTAAKCQAMWDGNCQAIFADVSALEQYTLDGVDAQIAMNIAGLMSGERIEGKDFPTFAEQGITLNGEPYAFDKEYSIFYPKGTPQEIIDEVDKALSEIAASPDYQKELADLGFVASYLSSKDNDAHMKEKRASFDEMIKNSPSLDELTAQ